MNLVAKEIVAARGDHRGSLVPGFADTAQRLPAPSSSNPFDVDGVAEWPDGSPRAAGRGAGSTHARHARPRRRRQRVRRPERPLLDAAPLPASTELPPRRTRICPRTDVSSSLRRGVSYLAPPDRIAGAFAGADL
jgi:hypothetical protein